MSSSLHVGVMAGQDKKKKDKKATRAKGNLEHLEVDAQMKVVSCSCAIRLRSQTRCPGTLASRVCISSGEEEGFPEAAVSCT